MKNKPKKSYALIAKDANLYEAYVSDGKERGFFIDLYDIPLVRQLIDNQKRLLKMYETLGIFGESMLKSININHPEREIPYQVGQLAQRSKLLLDDNKNYALEFAGDYIKKWIEVTKIYTGEIPEELKVYLDAECVMLVNDKLEVDMDKYNEMVAML